MYSGGGIRLKESERVESIPGARVTVNLFATFGVQPYVRERGQPAALAGGDAAPRDGDPVWRSARRERRSFGSC
jgi:hypothetical protein